MKTSLPPQRTCPKTGVPLAVSVAIPMGVIAAWKQGTVIDRTVMGFAVLGFSVPVFVVGYVLAYVFALELDWVPVQGYTPLANGIWPWLENLILPAIFKTPLTNGHTTLSLQRMAETEHSTVTTTTPRAP